MKPANPDGAQGSAVHFVQVTVYQSPDKDEAPAITDIEERLLNLQLRL